jgi:hypothetical protein
VGAKAKPKMSVDPETYDGCISLPLTKFVQYVLKGDLMVMRAVL